MLTSVKKVIISLIFDGRLISVWTEFLKHDHFFCNLDIYPKNGPMQQLDIEDSLVVDLVKQYAIEKEQGLLTVMDINP